MTAPSKLLTRWATEQAVPVGWMRQFYYMALLYQRIRKIAGDVVECGLGEGNTFSMLAYLVGSDQVDSRTLWGFDSFQGFPEPTVHDRSPRNPQKGEWRVSEEQVRQRLVQSGVQREFPQLDARIVPGFVEATLPQFPNRSIAFLHIDVDLYTGYHSALTELFPLVAEGGVVLFDEYREVSRTFNVTDKFPGATKAVDDYFAHLPYRVQHDPEAGKYFLIKKAGGR